MSQTAATARTTARPTRRPAPNRPRLQVVKPVPRRRSNLPFALLCTCILAGGLLAVLLFNLSLSQGAYEMHELQSRSSLASDQEGALREHLAAESASGKLAERAGKMGMVPAGSAVFLSLPDGKVLGVAPKQPAKDPLRIAGDRPVPAQGEDNPPRPTPSRTSSGGGISPQAGTASEAQNRPEGNSLRGTEQGR
ncbi:hypothetical protein SAMN05421595_1612 [Austwickia chelonae]|uniref:Cell division protein FtsL n=1 Tax=Austwickia chelonae NBRC 105200 TaxID=1184607 RepID=K6VMA9_9MICO|nr:hypothetical protein [Austwickia chelonae]GAB76485.1 hypothetical protein AUCHE_01_00470 [Austwickia chelonae NBRC 105200]SEW25540.1 hypothetical protein SAMN05421595_1612 [Austwickia chelonae]